MRGYALIAVIGMGLSVFGQSLDETRKAFQRGEYSTVVEQSSNALKERYRGEEWRLLHASALWETGQYHQAKEAIALAQQLYHYSVRIRLLGHKLYRSAGDSEKAKSALNELRLLTGVRRWGFDEPLDILAIGEAALLMGADPKLVLDNFYKPVQKADPKLREVHLAIGHLALQKHDYALAGKAFQEGLQNAPKDPDLLYGMAAALEPSDRTEMLVLLEQVFQSNQNHVPARLLLAEHLIDAEEYESAAEELDHIEKINPHRPEMWAFRAVIAHLRNQKEQEEKARAAALQFWSSNPQVDYLIGRKLAQKYRFAEGAELQRRALSFDPAFVPAQVELAQALLRLGKLEEGWSWAEKAANQDAYDVTSYNLVTLRDTIRDFVSRTNEHFVLRMHPHESEVYGENALQLLERAREHLTRKYGAQLEQPTMVEIFHQQKDFAVRTFGMPGQEGYLGVCFGNVITANSPAVRRMNWHSVLWHEYAHVVTLNLTRNRMPRWFSEGISVYEERLADPRWGERMNPEYRHLIREGKLTPIAELSSAFMAPPTPLHLQFAYYQSSLVVEFLVERYGIESVQKILRDLAEGKEMNSVIANHTTALPELEKEFQAFAKGVAEAFGSDLLWEKPKRNEEGEIDRIWAVTHPNNFWVLRDRAEELIEEGKENEAVPLLENLLQLYPMQGGDGSAYATLARMYRKNKLEDQEREVLTRWAKYDDECMEALLRLLELEHEKTEQINTYAARLLEINPLTPQPYRVLAEVAETAGSTPEAIFNYQTVLKLDPLDPAEIHYRLATLYRKQGDPQARRHVLLALEEAPRYRAAHKLLLQMTEPPTEKKGEEEASLSK